MWWEYLIIVVCLVAAASYVIWMISRTFSGKGSCSCGSSPGKCGVAASDCCSSAKDEQSPCGNHKPHH